MSEKNYEFRKLNSTDIFPMATLINKIGIRRFKEAFQNDEFRDALSGEDGDDALEKVGISVAFDVAGIVLEALPNCKNDIYGLLADVSNVEREELEKMEPAAFFEMIIDFIKKPELKDFMKVASKLFK